MRQAARAGEGAQETLSPAPYQEPSSCPEGDIQLPFDGGELKKPQPPPLEPMGGPGSGSWS